MIEAVNLTKKFGEFKAVDNMSFIFEDGAIYGLVGSNGSGKSTLLRMLAGVYYPDGGTIAADSYSIWNNPSVKSEIFFLSDNPYFFKGATLNEMVKFYKEMYQSFDSERFEYLSSVFPISRTMRIDNMSKGMQRQAALMLALSVKPKYLLLDEAFDGLDPVMRAVLKAILIEGMEQGNMTAIISSHNLRELEDLCDHVALIHNGKMLYCDNLESLQGSLHKIQAAYKTLPTRESFAELDILKATKTGSIMQLVARGDKTEISERIEATSPIFFEIITPTLEEIFIYEMEVEGYDVKNILG